MKRRDILIAGPVLAMSWKASGHASTSRDPIHLPDAAALRKAPGIAALMAELGLGTGDQFALLDGSRYELLDEDTPDPDLPLPGDALDQCLRVLPVRGQLSLAAWGPPWVPPKRRGEVSPDTPDISEALSRAVRRAIACHAELLLPPGLFRVTRPGTLLEKDYLGRHDGLVITGAGRDATIVYYDPDAPEPLLWNNDSVLGMRISRITFRTETPGAVWARLYSNGVSQDHRFCDVAWRGQWGIGVDLVRDPDTGNPGNNNSEFLFDGVLTANYASHFVLLSGRASDQNLNYWIRNSKLWGWVTVARLERGGHLHVTDCDVSGYSPKAPNHLFELLGEQHAEGVCSLIIRGLRVELKTSDALVLRSEWASGNIEITGLDLSSQTFRMTPAHPVIDLTLGAGRGPIISISDSQFAGKLRLRNRAVIGTDQARISFDRTTFHHGAGPDEVVIYEGSNAPRRIPNITFAGCRSAHLADRGIWDCNMGFLLGGACQVELRDLALPVDGGSFRLPKGARLVALLDAETMAPAKGVALIHDGADAMPLTVGQRMVRADGRPISVAAGADAGTARPRMVLLRYLA